MSMHRIVGLAALLVAASATANDFPTEARVEYVLECMYQHPGKQEYLYKCSCAIDEIAKTMKYDDYVEASTIARNQGMGGERAGVFRDPENVRDKAKGYRATQATARKSCLFKD